MSQAGPPEGESRGDRALHRVRQAVGDAEREAAEAELAAVIRLIARAVASRFGRFAQEREDFISDSPGYVFPVRGQFHPGKATGHFEGWCYRVLLNCFYDCCRLARRRHRVDGVTGEGADAETRRPEPADPSWRRDRELLEQQLDLHRPFSDRELRILGRLPVLRRVVSLALAGCSSRVDGRLWGEWLAEAGIEPPFPPAALLEADDQLQRRQLLAAALGMQPAAVRQHWHRAIETLKSLYGQERD